MDASAISRQLMQAASLVREARDTARLGGVDDGEMALHMARHAAKITARIAAELTTISESNLTELTG